MSFCSILTASCKGEDITVGTLRRAAGAGFRPGSRTLPCTPIQGTSS